MATRLRTQPDGTDVDVTLGDFATTRLSGRFTLVYLLRNTITYTYASRPVASR
jgi:hypothetical protein